MRLGPFSRLWLLVPACALAFLAWTTSQRLTHLAAVNALIPWTSAAAPIDARSSTGYVGGQRALIVPERNEKSFEWIAQTQESIAHGTFQLHHIDYENVPNGRAVHSTSPYRWWLTALTYIDRAFTRRPLGQSVERAALYADPVLLALAVVGFSFLCARHFGGAAAAILSVGLVTFFPLGAAFLPGTPDDLGATCLSTLGSLLPLLVGCRAREKAPRWFALAGIIGGFGIWLNPPVQVPILLGIFLGGLVSIWIGRGDHAPVFAAQPWRVWALSGSGGILVGYLAENFPNHLASWRLESVHPLYGVAWLGLGECLILAATALTAPSALRRPTSLARIVLALAAVASVPVVMWSSETEGFFARDLLWPRLASLPNGAYGKSIFVWSEIGGTPAALAAVLAPVALLALGSLLFFRRATTREHRACIALALCPAIIAFGVACTQLRWWSVVDSTALALVIPLAVVARPRWLAPFLTAAAASMGLFQLVPPRDPSGIPTLTASEAQEVIERHFAHWLAARTEEPGMVIFAPPHVTTTLSYFGGLRGLGTFSPDNKAGFSTSLAVAGANTMEEAENLLRGRGVRFLVIPSWDPFFDNFAALYLANNFSHRRSLLVSELRRWKLPLWLRPVPYQLPIGGAFENESVRVFEIVDEQRPATAMARLAEYLIETSDLASVAGVVEQLKKYPSDVGAQAARVQALKACGNAEEAAKELSVLEARLTTGADRFLPWDRRVSLSLTLAQAGRVAPAVVHARRCLAELDAAKLRTLSTGSLYNFQILLHATGLEITDPALHELARNLLPEDLRDKL